MTSMSMELQMLSILPRSMTVSYSCHPASLCLEVIPSQKIILQMMSSFSQRPSTEWQKCSMSSLESITQTNTTSILDQLDIQELLVAKSMPSTELPIIQQVSYILTPFILFYRNIFPCTWEKQLRLLVGTKTGPTNDLCRWLYKCNTPIFKSTKEWS